MTNQENKDKNTKFNEIVNWFIANSDNNYSKKKRRNDSNKLVPIFAIIMSISFVIYAVILFIVITKNSSYCICKILIYYLAFLLLILMIFVLFNKFKRKKATSVDENSIENISDSQKLILLFYIKDQINTELSRPTFLYFVIDTFVFSIFPYVVGLLLADKTENNVEIIIIAIITLIIMVIFLVSKIAKNPISIKRKRALKAMSNDVDKLIYELLSKDISIK